MADTKKTHILKTWPPYYDAVASGEKNFEVRRDDRGFQKGDVLVLQRTEEATAFHGHVECDFDGKVKFEIRKRITWILTGGQFGVEPGYVVMGLADV